jgi:hypothetical protein
MISNEQTNIFDKNTCTTLAPCNNTCGLSKSDIKKLEKIKKKQEECFQKEERLKVIREILTELNLPENKKNIELVNKHASKHDSIQDFLNEIKNQQNEKEESDLTEQQVSNETFLKNLPYLFRFLNEIPEKIC